MDGETDSGGTLPSFSGYKRGRWRIVLSDLQDSVNVTVTVRYKLAHLLVFLSGLPVWADTKGQI